MTCYSHVVVRSWSHLPCWLTTGLVTWGLWHWLTTSQNGFYWFKDRFQNVLQGWAPGTNWLRRCVCLCSTEAWPVPWLTASSAVCASTRFDNVNNRGDVERTSVTLAKQNNKSSRNWLSIQIWKEKIHVGYNVETLSSPSLPLDHCIHQPLKEHLALSSATTHLLLPLLASGKTVVRY